MAEGIWPWVLDPCPRAASWSVDTHSWWNKRGIAPDVEISLG